MSEENVQTESIDVLDEDRCLTVQRLVGRFRHTGIEMDAACGSIAQRKGPERSRLCHAGRG